MNHQIIRMGEIENEPDTLVQHVGIKVVRSQQMRTLLNILALRAHLIQYLVGTFDFAL